jgi:hypothetical protein
MVYKPFLLCSIAIGRIGFPIPLTPRPPSEFGAASTPLIGLNI